MSAEDKGVAGVGILRVDHIGVVVDEMAAAADELSSLLGLADDGPRLHTDQIDAAFLACDGARVELLEARDPGRARLAAGQAARIDHIAFEVEDVHRAHTALSAAGIALQSEPLAMGGMRFFFTEPEAVRGLTLQFLDRCGEDADGG